MRAALPLALVLLLGAVASPAEAGVLVWPKGELVVVDTEEVLVVWDAARKVEHIIHRASFTTRSAQFGFLLPTPSQPQIAEASDAVFERLAEASHPTRIGKTKVSGVVAGFGLYDPRQWIATDSAAMAGERVRSAWTTRVAGIDATTLEASDTESVASWLHGHGYEPRPAFVGWLEPYVEKKWKLTAFRIVNNARDKTSIGSAAVRLTFSTDRPVIPYRDPTDLQDEGEPRARTLRVFFVGEGRVQPGLGDPPSGWPGQLKFASPLVDPVSTLAGAIAAKDLPPKPWLSAFEDTATSRLTGDDLFFAHSEEKAMLARSTRVDRQVKLHVPVDLLALLGVVGVALVLRRRRTPEPVAARRFVAGIAPKEKPAGKLAKKAGAEPETPAAEEPGPATDADAPPGDARGPGADAGDEAGA